MNELYQKVLKAMQEENKELAVALCSTALSEDKIKVVDLYEMILLPALNHVVEEYQADDDLIWREHVRSGIIRTIMELAYPFVLQERKKTTEGKGKVIVLCPEFEDHELGARMVSDFFLMEGFDSTFIGARTPQSTLLKAVEIVKPDYLCISVTNYYHLVSVKKTIELIKESYQGELRIILGGRAFNSNPEAYISVGGDILLQNYDDITKFSEGEAQDEISI